MAEIRRAAFLIATPHSQGQKELTGADADVRNFREFLMSPFGGAWRADEIVTRLDPSRKDVDLKRDKMNGADYALTFFAGHGCHNKRTDEGSLCLNFGDMISVNELAPRVRRQLMVIDACREFAFLHEERMKTFAALKEGAAVPSAAYIDACRAAYNLLIMAGRRGGRRCMGALSTRLPENHRKVGTSLSPSSALTLNGRLGVCPSNTLQYV